MNEDYISTRDELAYSIWSKIMEVKGYELGMGAIVSDVQYVLDKLFDQKKSGDVVSLK